MRLFGSINNRIMESSAPPVPEVGMGATRLQYSDRTACTVLAVENNGKRVTVREDLSIRTDSNGMSDSQSYRYEPNPEGATWTYTLRKNGRWIREGEPMRGGEVLLLGERASYHDYSF